MQFVSLAALLPLYVAAPDVAKVEALYEQALYEEALAELRTPCTDPGRARCERIRAFVQIAVGNATEGRASFDRMVLADSTLELGENASPKLRELHREAKAAIDEVLALRLEPAQAVGADGRLLLELRNPPTVVLNAATVHIAFPPNHTLDENVELQLEGQVWSGVQVVPSEAATQGAARYRLTAVLPSGVAVAIGSSERPLELPLQSADAEPSTRGGWQTATPEPSPSDPAPPKEGGLPDWAFWSLIGGGAAVTVAVGVILAVVLTQDPDPGTINVNIAFGDE